MTNQLVIDALNMAAWTRRHTSIDKVICQTDAGSHYTSIDYTQRLIDEGVVPSIGTVGDSFDNAMAESMFSLFKSELFRNPVVLARVGGHWRGLDDIEVETCKWISWFNSERLHAEIGNSTPMEIEEDYSRVSQVKAA